MQGGLLLGLFSPEQVGLAPIQKVWPGLGLVNIVTVKIILTDQTAANIRPI